MSPTQWHTYKHDHCHVHDGAPADVGATCARVPSPSHIGRPVMVMTLHRLSAGAGYQYLLKHTAAGDCDRAGVAPLTEIGRAHV